MSDLWAGILIGACVGILVDGVVFDLIPWRRAFGNKADRMAD